MRILPDIAIGGLSVGEPFDVYEELLSESALLLLRTSRDMLWDREPDFILTAIRIWYRYV